MDTFARSSSGAMVARDGVRCDVARDGGLQTVTTPPPGPAKIRRQKKQVRCYNER